MANEFEEFNRYWGDCIGAWKGRTGISRAAVIHGLRSGGNGKEIDQDWPISINIRNDQWNTRSYKFSTFKSNFTPVPYQSRMINADRFLAYFMCNIRRQYLKGVTIQRFQESLRLTDAHIDLMSAWDGGEFTRTPEWHSYLAHFFDPYPSFWEALEKIFSGKYYGVAFSKYFGLVNNRRISRPLLYYKTLQAGIFPDTATLLLDSRYTDLQRRVAKQMPGITVRLITVKKPKLKELLDGEQ